MNDFRDVIYERKMFIRLATGQCKKDDWPDKVSKAQDKRFFSSTNFTE